VNLVKQVGAEPQGRCG